MVQRQCYVGRGNIQMTKKVGMRKQLKTNLNWIETIFKSTFFAQKVLFSEIPSSKTDNSEKRNHNIFLEIWDHVTMNTTTFSKLFSSEIQVSVNLIC